MRHIWIPLLNLTIVGMLSAQQTTPLYILFNSTCMDQLEYRYVYAGTTVMAYSVHPTMNEQYILTAGSGGINSPTLPKNTVNCKDYALNEQFLNDVNNITRQVYIVHQLSKGYVLTPIIAATQVMRSGTYYLFRAPNYSFAVDTSNLVYESNIATGTSAWYIYFNGLKIRGCHYEYSFKREPTKTNQERSEFDFIPGIGMISERTGMSAAEAENNHFRLIKVNGVALDDYISMRCQDKTTKTTAPLSQWSPQVNYGTGGGVVREGDKELASMQNNPAATGTTMLPPPLVNCPEQPGEGYHIVQPGETLNGISRAYEVSVKSLVGWNKIKDPDVINVCQKIWLHKPPANVATLASKGNAGMPSTYSTPGSTVVRQDIYWKSNTGYQQPAPYNYTTPQTYTQPQPTYTPPTQTLVHTVQKGETLYGIGLKYGLAESEIRRINNYPATGDIIVKPGMQLLVSDCCPAQNAGAYQQPAPNPATTTYPSLTTGGQPSTSQPNTSQPYTSQPYTSQPANTGTGVLPELYSTPSTAQPTPNYTTTPNNTAVQPAPTQTKPVTYFQEYIVREGDNLNSIAIKFKVSAQELALVNNKDPNETLIAGQRLLIPKN